MSSPHLLPPLLQSAAPQLAAQSKSITTRTDGLAAVHRVRSTGDAIMMMNEWHISINTKRTWRTNGAVTLFVSRFLTTINVNVLVNEPVWFRVSV